MREDELSFDPALEAELNLLDRDMPHFQASNAMPKPLRTP